MNASPRGGPSRTSGYVRIAIDTRQAPMPPAAVSRGWIESTAEQIGVDPVAVLGKLQCDKALDYRTALAKGAPNVSEHLGRWG
jgi:hypothetical protein